MLKQTVERWRQELAVQHQEIGKEIGALQSVLRLFERSAGRQPTPEEEATFAAILREQGLDAALDRALSASPG
jgi:predicted transcriptional regulator